MSNSNPLRAAIEKRWYGSPGFLRLLLPLEKLFYSLSQRRKHKLQQQAFRSPIPLVVVGNISVGGTGKTPTIIELVKYLQERGKVPGVISRGYGRQSEGLRLLDDESTTEEVGDEPLLIYQACACPVVVSESRVEAINYLCEHTDCQIILSDDGLQDYRIERTGEIVIVDGERQFGNGHLMPVGPLREYPARLDQANWVLFNMPSEGGGELPDSIQTQVFSIQVRAKQLRQISTGKSFAPEHFKESDNILAVAGLGNPNKFFYTLKSIGYGFEERVFPDHYQYEADDFVECDDHIVIMTSKDAVKCAPFAKENMYSLDIRLHIPETFLTDFYQTIFDN